MDLIKRCNKCGLIKDANDFNKNKAISDGLAFYCRMCRKKYYEENREIISKQAKKYYQKNQEAHKLHRLKHREARLKYARMYAQKNKKKIREYRNNRLQTDKKYALIKRMRENVCSRVKSKNHNGKLLRLLPYTIDELLIRLEATMPDGYTWNDFLTGRLHIDHIIPISVFNFETPDDIDFQRGWALNNLQLLPAKENIAKSTKLTNNFQPSLLV